jgi:cytochrome P450
MNGDDDQRTLTYPLPCPAALEPPPAWARLRRECPVARVTLPSGDEAKLITRYEDVRALLSDTRFGLWLNAPDAARLSDTESGGLFSSEASDTLPTTGAEHQAWRRMISKWFTVKRMAALRPGIEAMAGQLIDEMMDHGQPADLRASLGFPLPVWAICEMLGVPGSDRDKFAYWSGTILNLTSYPEAEIQAAQAEFGEYLSAHIAAKRARPGDDLLSELVTTLDADGAPLADEMLIMTGQALLVAGHETTTNMIGKMTAMLLADRQRWEQLLADRSLVRAAVEEVLRFDANPGLGLARYLTEEVEIADTTLPQGTTVLCETAAGNRDDSAFERAGEMDFTRNPNPHLAFGAGAHSCLGQALARTELHTVLGVMLDRLPSLELAVPAQELRRVEGLVVVGGLREVPVRW